MSQELLTALAAWRADRSNTALACAVDDASARVPRETPPKKHQHRWWTTRARTYDAEVVSSLLATVRWNARGKNVSWRTILLRATPLVPRLTVTPETPPGEWMNLTDRVGLMLAWPDDPRVAMCLAELLHERPFAFDRFRRERADPVRDAIVERIIAIGDLRAIELANVSYRRNAPPELAAASVNSPPPRSAAARDPTLDGVWDAVVEDPSLERRLILADALSERGDVRGEMIALQCAPLLAIEKARAAGETLDPSGLFGANAERITKAIETHWHRWLGDVALVASRASRFSGGLLYDVYLGHSATPPWAWDRAGGHRELCAVARVSPSPRVSPVTYLRFLERLRRVPRWVVVDDDILPELVAARMHRLTGVRLRTRRPLASAVRDLLEALPALERIDLEHVEPGWLPAIRELAEQVSIELRFFIDRVYAVERTLLDELRALPNVLVLND